MRILRGLSSRHLSCGCLAGVYETYDGEIVAIVDARGAHCTDTAHIEGNIVPREVAGTRHESTSASSRE
jgi:hypothetical protein